MAGSYRHELRLWKTRVQLSATFAQNKLTQVKEIIFLYTALYLYKT